MQHSVVHSQLLETIHESNPSVILTFSPQLFVISVYRSVLLPHLKTRITSHHTKEIKII